MNDLRRHSYNCGGWLFASLLAHAVTSQAMAQTAADTGTEPGTSVYVILTCLGFTLLLLALGFLAFFWVKRKLHLQRTLIVEQATARLARAERIAGLGSWEGNPVTGSMISSTAFQDMLHLESTEKNGYRSLIDRIPKDDRSRVTHFLLKAYAAEESSRIDFKVEVPGGKTKWLECIVQTDRDLFSRSKVQHGVILDITNRKRSEEALIDARLSAERANHAKSMFLANMSHELRTPLNAIIGFADTLLLGTFGELKNDKQKEYLEDIRKSGDHLLNVIGDILDLAAIEVGRRELHEDWFSIDEALEDCISLLSPQAGKWKISLKLDIQTPNTDVLADATQFRQVIINLLSNALKFTPEGGAVTLSMKADPLEGIFVAVADTGVGMTEDELRVALQEFGTNNAYLHEDANGTGLGLPLSRTIVDRHGGKLVLQSEKGQGTTALVHLPPERLRR